MEEGFMTYADRQYIYTARKNELHHHDHEMSILKLKISQLAKAVEWEFKQHESRIQELQQLEDALAEKKSAGRPETPSTLQPLTQNGSKVEPQKRKTLGKRKTKRRITGEPTTELVEEIPA